MTKHPCLPTSRTTAGSTSCRNATTRSSIRSSKPPRRHAPTATRRRSATTTPAAWTRAASTPRALAPLEGTDRIAALGSAADLPPWSRPCTRKGVGVLFGFGSTPDFKDASSVIAGTATRRAGTARPRLLREGRRDSEKLRAAVHGPRRPRCCGSPATRRRRPTPAQQAIMRDRDRVAKAALDA